MVLLLSQLIVFTVCFSFSLSVKKWRAYSVFEYFFSVLLRSSLTNFKFINSGVCLGKKKKKKKDLLRRGGSILPRVTQRPSLLQRHRFSLIDVITHSFLGFAEMLPAQEVVTIDITSSNDKYVN